MNIRTFFIAALVAVSTLSSLAAYGATKAVTLDVPGMTCSLCPITVKKALTKVNGVIKAEVSFDKRQAVVTFDDAKTNVGTLTKATADTGYPATVKR